MAKPIPKKKAKVDAAVAEQVEEYKRLSEKRFEIANAAYRAQDEKTRAVLNAIQDQLLVGASGTIRVYVGGKDAIAVPVDMEYVEYNTLYVATEILKDLALLDVKVANYKFPDVFCVECGDKLKKKKKKR